MIGVILCGGQSTRMGTDKGLLKFNAVTWVQNAAEKLLSLSIPAVISVNSNQFIDYSKIFNIKDLVVDNGSLEIRGPLCGVISVYLQNPTQDILVLACDMPLMKTEILKDLIEQYHQNPKHEAVVFTNGGESEPLCGIYTSKGLSHIYDLYKTGQLQKHSMKYILEYVSTFFIPLPDDKKKYFANFNTHAGINGL